MDSYPKKICCDCLETIEKAHELREISVRTDDSFRTGTFVILPAKNEKSLEKSKSSETSEPKVTKKRRKASTEDENCPYGCTKTAAETEKLSKIENKLDKLMDNLGDVDKLQIKMVHLEKKVSNQEHDLRTNKTFITNCLENAIGSKPSSFPTKLCATNVSELNAVDRSLMSPLNSEYFVKYLNNNIGKSPDFKSYMKRALEIVMASDFKAQLSFANHIRNLHSYLIISDCCSTKFNVSKKDIETYVARNIANLKNYNKVGKFKRLGVGETSGETSSSSYLSEPEIKAEVTECYFEVRELN